MQNLLRLFISISVICFFYPVTAAAQLDSDFRGGGGILVGPSSTACDDTKEGGLRYDATEKVFEYCNGTEWSPIKTVGACSDTTPHAFTFPDATETAFNALMSSNIVQIMGLGCTVSMAVSGPGAPSFRTCADNACGTVLQDWTSASAPISNNEYLQIRQTSGPHHSHTQTATISVGSLSTVWRVKTEVGDCFNDPPPPVGTVCSDGTVYAGISPDGDVKMYTTPCDAGMSWNGTACAGTRVTRTFNNGSNNFMNPSLYFSQTDGDGNTAGLYADTGAAAPYTAAGYCATLSAHGHSDWYLPAIMELSLIIAEQTAIGGIPASGNHYYWSSTDNAVANVNAWRINRTGSAMVYGEYDSYSIRCVRKQ